MFDKTRSDAQKNDQRDRIDDDSAERKALNASASDQIIRVRRFAMPVVITVCGKEYTIRPPSFFLSNLITDFWNDYVKQLSKKSEHFKQLLASRGKDTITGAVENIENHEIDIDKVVDTYEKFVNETREIVNLKDERIFRLVQLILYDAERPEWKDKYDSWPPDAVLDDAVPLKMLERNAALTEIDEVLQVYAQMNKPEIPRKNFELLGHAMM